MKDRLLNRTFFVIFIAIFALITLVDSIAFYIAFQNSLQKSRIYTWQENEQAVNRITERLNNLFVDNNQLAVGLQRMRWVIKLSSMTNVFDDDFPYEIQLEIINDYLFTPGVNDMTQSRFIYFPYRNLIVGANAWNDAGYYMHKMLNIPYENRNDILNRIKASHSICNFFLPESRSDTSTNLANRMLIAFPINEGTSLKKAYLCIVLKTDVIVDTLKGYMPQGITGLEIKDAGEQYTYLSLGHATAESHVEQRSVNIVNWIIEYYISPNVITLNQESFQFVIPFLILFFIGLIVSYVIAYFVYHPLEKLLVGINGNNHSKNVIRDLNHSVNSIMDQYQKSRKTIILHHLISGYFDQDDHEENVLGFNDHMRMQVFVCVPIEKTNVDTEWIKHLDETLSRMNNINYQMLESYNRNFAVIVGYRSDEAIEKYSEQILNTCICDEKNEVYVGNLSQGYVGISISYQSALERQLILSSNGKLSYYFPLEWEKMYLASLQQGNQNAAVSILHKVLDENEKRLTTGEIDRTDLYRLTSRLRTDLHRIICEMNMDENIINPIDHISKLSNWSNLYQEIIHVTEVICQIISSKNISESQSEYRITKYVDTHFHEADLSITTLQNVFGISATTLNRYIKSVTGQTFLPYLTMRRMEEAKTLMQSGTIKVSVIAELVGYENEYSFRRAFQHYTGVKIQDYQQFMENQLTNSKENEKQGIAPGSQEGKLSS